MFVASRAAIQDKRKTRRLPGLFRDSLCEARPEAKRFRSGKRGIPALARRDAAGKFADSRPRAGKYAPPASAVPTNLRLRRRKLLRQACLLRNGQCGIILADWTERAFHAALPIRVMIRATGASHMAHEQDIRDMTGVMSRFIALVGKKLPDDVEAKPADLRTKENSPPAKTIYDTMAERKKSRPLPRSASRSVLSSNSPGQDGHSPESRKNRRRQNLQ